MELKMNENTQKIDIFRNDAGINGSIRKAVFGADFDVQIIQKDVFIYNKSLDSCMDTFRRYGMKFAKTITVDVPSYGVECI
jgi:hypothetical protein